MTPTAILDLLACGGTIALLALWCIVLLRDHRAAPAARAAMAMALAIGAYVVSGILVVIAPATLPALLCDVSSVMAAPLLWLFARLWFDDRARVGARNWALIGGFAALPLTQLALVIVAGRFSILIWTLVRIGMIGFGLSAMWVAWRGRDSDLVEPRRAFRLALEFGHVLGRVTAQAQMGTQLAIVAVTLAAVAGLHAARSPHLFAPPPAPEPAGEPLPARAVVESPLTARLRHVMGHDRAYRAEGFSLTALAQLLGEPEYRVRRAINGELGFRNFTAFLNTYRLAEVKAALADPAQREVPILTIAIDAGFGSLGPFNRAFREAEGMTPSEWRSKLLVDSGIG
jgi:AraC-like DNA-binding protein